MFPFLYIITIFLDWTRKFSRAWRFIQGTAMLEQDMSWWNCWQLLLLYYTQIVRNRSEFLPQISSFPLALHLRVSFGLLNSLAPLADGLVSEQFSFYGVRLLTSLPTSNLADQDIPLRLAPTPWLVWHGWPYQ
jgi:cytosine/uracil/thiamine/allantoin permease